MSNDFGNCMKYEMEYPGICWDYLVMEGCWEFSGLKSLSDILIEEVGVEITNRAEFSDRVLAMFEKMHEDGVIRPLSA